jgi:hypothetical protein
VFETLKHVGWWCRFKVVNRFIDEEEQGTEKVAGHVLTGRLSLYAHYRHIPYNDVIWIILEDSPQLVVQELTGNLLRVGVRYRPTDVAIQANIPMAVWYTPLTVRPETPDRTGRRVVLYPHVPVWSPGGARPHKEPSFWSLYDYQRQIIEMSGRKLYSLRQFEMMLIMCC